MIENYEAVREAIARWVWPQYNESSQKMFNPLNNPADAWSLQCAIVAWCDERGYTLEWPNNTYCAINHDTNCGLEWIASGTGATPEEALVRAWMQAFMS